MKQTLFLLIAVLYTATAYAASIPESTASEQYKAQHKEKAEKLLSVRERLDQLIWGPEVLAQKFETRFTRLWDDLLQQQDKYAVLSNFPFTSMIAAKATGNEVLDLNIRKTTFSKRGQKMTPEQWRAMLVSYQAQGYLIEQTEWHHSRFVPASKDGPATSVVNMSIHAYREKPVHRLTIKGQLDVVWSDKLDAEGIPVPDVITVSKMEIVDRQAAAVFKEVFRISSTKEHRRVLPLHVYDLNNDGLPEIVLGGQNMVLWNKGKGKFTAESLITDERSLFDAAVIADFTGDGNVDYVAVDETQHPILYEGNASGQFVKPATKIADVKFKLPKTFTAGDIDNDGDLDLYIANYKFPYRKGQMPSPYYDANDGFPAYLLRNDGHGKFTDMTEASGLATKRFRRAFSSSFVDFDNDHDLDLVVVSDFAGVDIFFNDGTGKFTDATNDLGVNRHLFGMGHTFADYDLDGDLDMYVIGMSSTTARRLERLGLVRDDKPEHNQMRKYMGYGNRMFLWQDGKFVQAPFNDQVARTGWSWGASSFDFDNDGDKDIFVANGHYSGKSTQDYCSSFWRHDIYDEGKENDAKNVMYQKSSKKLREANISWNGYEHKVMLMNQQGKGFTNIAYLLGLAFEYDGRAVVADDLDADGRVDLLVVEYHTEGLGKDTYTLHVYSNVFDGAGHWLGVRLSDHGPGLSPIGATVTVKGPAGTQMTRLVTGDSFSSQHSTTVHFGLGGVSSVDEIEVRWPNGVTSVVKRPVVDQYVTISPPVSIR